MDPDNRLVAGELERRWNEALKRYNIVEEELKALRDGQPETLDDETRRALLALGEDLPSLWNDPQSSNQIKKRIMRTLLHEIVVSKEGEKMTMLLHWQGGDHTSLEFLKNKVGYHRYVTPSNVVELVGKLARVQPDRSIVSILNRLGVRTGHGHNWTEARLRTFRCNHKIAVYSEGERLARGEMTLEETAVMLNVSRESIRRLIVSKMLPAHQACKAAPWIIKRADVEKLLSRGDVAGPRTQGADQLSLKLQ